MKARSTMGLVGSPGRRTMRRFAQRGRRTGQGHRKVEDPRTGSAAQSTGASAANGHERAGNGPASQEDKLARLLRTAAGLMADRGYEQTTIRDVSRETGFSLAGLYYYFRSKEDLLYQIQHRTFASLLDRQASIAAGSGSAEERFRRLVDSHLSFFTEHANEMKVCAFELQSLKGDAYEEIEELRRRYYRIMAGVIAELIGADAAHRADEAGEARSDADGRVRHHALFIFGMLNWTFMWFDPGRDGPVERLGREMVDMVLPGLGAGRAGGDRTGGERTGGKHTDGTRSGGGDDRDAR